MSTAPTESPAIASIMHAVWTGDALCVFGESAAPIAAVASSTSRNGRPPAWAMTAAALHEALGKITPDGLLASSAAEDAVRVWLPVRGEAPVPHQEIGSPIPPERPADLSAYKLPALRFGPADVMDLLMGLDDSALQAHGRSLRYWATLARFAVSLIARRKFCPDVIEAGPGELLGRWRLLTHDPAELLWLERYVAVMPPVCRAAVTDEPLDANDAVEGFLSLTTDAVIRRVLAGDDFFQQITRKARESSAWELKWLASLVAADTRVHAEADDNDAGAVNIRNWIGQAEEDTGPSPKLRFILVEPAEGAKPSEAAWRLAFEMRLPETGEPLDLTQVWAERNDAPTVLGSHLLSRRVQLVSQLTRAAEVCPELRRALSRARGSAVRLTTAEAHAFLRERAPLLAADGYEIVLPEWAAISDQQLGLELVVEPRATHGTGDRDFGLSPLGLSSLLDFNWRVAIGGEQLTMDEFQKIAAQKAPLVRLRGKWIGIDHETAARALAFLESRPKGPITLMQAVRLAGGAEEIDSGLPILGLSGADWIEGFLSQTPELKIEAFDPPSEFHGELRPYQLRGLHWLSFLDQIGIGACLADDMGLGKTIQLIALLLHERRDGKKVGPTLLFSPMSVVGNWEREIQRFAPTLRVLVHHGPLRLSGDAFVEAAEQHDVILTTYGLADREAPGFSRVQWHRIAMDEAQKIKNPTARQTVALRTLIAAHRIALTGTPIENHLSELWSIMEVLNPGLLGSATAFRARFALPIEKMGDQNRSDQLRRLIRPFVLRRLKSDPIISRDLPEKMEMRVFCNLTPEQAALYERTVTQTLGEIETATGIRRRGLILATLTKLKQICNHPAHFLADQSALDDRSGKCERLIEMLEEVLDEGDEALVFTQFKQMGTLLQRLMQDRLKIEVPFLHGGTPMKKRRDMVEAFQQEGGKWRVFLLSLKAGGFGLNLTKANHVFHFDRWWNPAVEEQAADRVHRIGQLRRVQIHKFVCIGTVEERIDRLLAEKAALADRIVGSGDEWLTGMSTVELRDYLALSNEAVSES